MLAAKLAVFMRISEIQNQPYDYNKIVFVLIFKRNCCINIQIKCIFHLLDKCINICIYSRRHRSESPTPSLLSMKSEASKGGIPNFSDQPRPPHTQYVNPYI